ncbi:MAG: LpqB family beta-propeller domain-containing protein [Actinomycetota bacterium]
MRRSGLTLVLVAAVLLSGCAALPIEGAVRIGPDLSAPLGTESFYYSPSSPVSGANEVDVLNGFLAAGTGPQNDYSVAREYLSESLRASWNPNQEVLIQRSAPEIFMLEEGKAQVAIDLSARIGPDGVYATVAPGTQVLLDFQLAKESGEWRIVSAPDATVIIRPVFDVIFRSYSIHFLDRAQKHLVPELRWFALTPATGTRLVNALLRGPSPWLKPAVVSAIPSGTRLSIDAVTVENGTALVDLTARALVATRADRSLMKAQLAATLSQLPSVQKVAISIERSRQDIPDQQPPLNVEGSAPLVALSGDALDVVAGSELEIPNSNSSFFSQLKASGIAISRSTGWLAALAPAGIYRSRYDELGSTVELVDPRSQQLNPTYDKEGFLWTITKAQGSEIRVTSSGGDRITISAPWAVNRSIRSFSISPEGTRVVLVTEQPLGPELLISAIVRDRAGNPISLTEPLSVSEITNPKSVQFIDNNTVAIVNEVESLGSVQLLTLGGLSRTLVSIPGASEVFAGGQSGALHLLTSSGEVYIYRGQSWTLSLDGVQSLAVAR